MIESSPGSHEHTAEFKNAPRLEQGPGGEEEAALWRDPVVVSYSFRRHGKYERDRASHMRGALTAEGIAGARTAAESWAQRLPDNAEVSIYQSPSFIAAVRERVDEATGEVYPVRPMRATITASVYEKAVFGDLKAAKTDTGESISGRRVTERAIGDFLENSVSQGAVGDFYDVLGETYHGLTPEFWQDYIDDKLEPRVADAIKNVGGADSLQLAQNLTGLISRTDPELADRAQEEKAKQAVIAVTHGEGINAFNHYLAQYAEQNGAPGAERFGELTSSDFGFNEGVDAHVAGGQMTVVAKKDDQSSELKTDIKQFAGYLAQLRTDKVAHEAQADS